MVIKDIIRSTCWRQTVKARIKRGYRDVMLATVTHPSWLLTTHCPFGRLIDFAYGESQDANFDLIADQDEV